MSHVCSISNSAILEEVVRESQEGRRTGFVDVDLASPAVDAVFAVMKRNGTVLDAAIFRTANARRPRATANRVRGRGRTDEDNAARRPRRSGVRARCDANGAFLLTRRACEAGVMVPVGTDGMSRGDSVFPIINRLRKLEAAEEPLAEDATAELSSLQVERANLEERLVPLREERANLLRKVRLVTLRRQYRELPVYAGDEIKVRLMERDIFADDLCGTWTVRLDRAVLEKGFLKLGSPQRTYVILAFAPR